jgi:hypothetical protein
VFADPEGMHPIARLSFGQAAWLELPAPGMGLGRVAIRGPVSVQGWLEVGQWTHLTTRPLWVSGEHVVIPRFAEVRIVGAIDREHVLVRADTSLAFPPSVDVVASCADLTSWDRIAYDEALPWPEASEALEAQNPSPFVAPTAKHVDLLEAPNGKPVFTLFAESTAQGYDRRIAPDGEPTFENLSGGPLSFSLLESRAGFVHVHAQTDALLLDGWLPSSLVANSPPNGELRTLRVQHRPRQLVAPGHLTSRREGLRGTNLGRFFGRVFRLGSQPSRGHALLDTGERCAD